MVCRIYLYRYIDVFNEKFCKKCVWIFLLINCFFSPVVWEWFCSSVSPQSGVKLIRSLLHRLKGQDSLCSTVHSTHSLTHLCSHSRLALAGCVTRKALLALPTALQESQLPYSGWHPYMKPCCVYYFLSGSSGSRQTIVSKKTLSSHILGMSILLSIFFLRCQVSLGNCFLVGALTL